MVSDLSEVNDSISRAITEFCRQCVAVGWGSASRHTMHIQQACPASMHVHTHLCTCPHTCAHKSDHCGVGLSVSFAKDGVTAIVMGKPRKHKSPWVGVMDLMGPGFYPGHLVQGPRSLSSSQKLCTARELLLDESPGRAEEPCTGPLASVFFAVRKK